MPFQTRILNPRMIRTLATVFAGLLGLAFGSFLNVCLSRWPEGESIAHPRSHCRNCQHTLAWWENIPLLSWIMLRGRCRECKAWISIRYPLVELALGCLWGCTVWNSSLWNPDPDRTALTFSIGVFRVVAGLIFYWLALALAFLDAEHLWLPNILTLPGILLGILAYSLPEVVQRYWGTFTAQDPGWVASVLERLVSIFICAGLLLLIRWLYWVFRHREGMGLGDVKLIAMLAAWLGLSSTLFAFFIGSIVGAIAGLVVIAVPTLRDEGQGWATSKLPFGTFLCIGGILSNLWGDRIIAAYLRAIGF